VKIRKISRRRSPKYAELTHFTLLFCRARQRNVQRFLTHVQAIVLLIKSFVWWRSHRCRCRLCWQQISKGHPLTGEKEFPLVLKFSFTIQRGSDMFFDLDSILH